MRRFVRWLRQEDVIDDLVEHLAREGEETLLLLAEAGELHRQLAHKRRAEEEADARDARVAEAELAYSTLLAKQQRIEQALGDLLDAYRAAA